MENICYKIKISHRVKRLALKISSSQGLEVIVPPATPSTIIKKFVHANRAFIVKHQHLIKAFEKPFIPPHTIKLHALNQSWNIIYANEATKQCNIKIFPEKILLSKKNSSKSIFQKMMKIFLKKIAIEHLSPHLDQLSQQHQLPYQQLVYRVQRTRWGSCSCQKNITLNAALLFMPIQTVHYVMIHELCHTKHFNHSKCFWTTLAQYMPNYAQHQKILKQPEQYLPDWF